jgi:hypothetical protein
MEVLQTVYEEAVAQYDKKKPTHLQEILFSAFFFLVLFASKVCCKSVMRVARRCCCFNQWGHAEKQVSFSWETSGIQEEHSRLSF